MSCPDVNEALPTAGTSRSHGGYQTVGFLLLLSAILASVGNAASAPSDWRLLLPSKVIQYEQFNPEEFDVAYANGTFVGAGGNYATTSPDGLNWSPIIRSGRSHYFSSVTFGSGTFVSGWGGGISTSADGLYWEHHPGFGNDIELIRIRFLNGLFVAIGREFSYDFRMGGVLYTSTNGLQWTQRLRSPPSDAIDVDFVGIAYGNGRFVALGVEYEGSFSEGVTYISSDGVEWTRAAANPLVTDPFDIAFGADGFILLNRQPNQILTSSDGTSWQLRHELEAPWSWRTIAASGERIVCLAQQRIENSQIRPGLAVVSQDGVSWQQSSVPGSVPRHLFSEGTNFFAIGTRSLLESRDGIAWTERFAPHPLDVVAGGLNDVTYGDQGFVAVGQRGTVICSRDGAAWEKRTSGTERHLYAAIHAGGRYFAAGDGGTLLHSSEGETWTSTDLGATLSLGPLTHGAGRFVLMAYRSNGFFWTSEDGITWRLRFSGVLSTFTYFPAAAFGNGRFVATGDNGVVTSTNGIAWQKVNHSEPYVTASFGQMIYDGERFVVQSSLGLLASPDGLSWVTLDETVPYSIGYGDGSLVAARFATKDFWGDDIGALALSPDGSAWTALGPLSFQGSSLLLRFAYGAGRFVAVGRNSDDSARLLISGVKPPQLNLRREAAQFVLRIRGAAGSNWNLQRSSTLNGWQTLGPVTLGADPLDIELAPTAESQGFWRLAAPEQ